MVFSLSERRKKLFLFFGLILLVLCFFLLSRMYLHKDERAFHSLTQTLFLEEMYANTLDLHYTLADPAAFGITDYEPTLPCYDASAREASGRRLTEVLDELHRIRKEKLDPQDARLYTLLTNSLELSQEINAYEYQNEPFSPTSGIHAELPILLAEYAFRGVRDVEDYLALLSQVPDYYASLLLYEQEKNAAGNPMPYSRLEEAAKQCDTIVTLQSVKMGRHFLQTTFHEKLEVLISEGLLSEESAEGYLRENDRLLLDKILPAYASLKEGLLALEDKSILPRGLAALPGGQEYYSLLLQSSTGSSRPVSEIRALLEKQYEQEYFFLQNTLREHPEAAKLFTSGAYTSFQNRSPEDMLADLQSCMAADFPPLPVAGTNTLAVKEVNASLCDYCAPAFYLTAPIDDCRNSVIYINPSKTSDGVDTYTTLAHEGYPGHLYQDLFRKSGQALFPVLPGETLLHYGGFQEGWAIYTEFYAYDYASAYAAKQGSKQEKICIQLEKHNRSLLLCLYSLLDIAIHYDNASPSQIAETLCPLGITDPESVESIYSYIAGEPCNYPKYYLGYLEILTLRELAAKKWGDDYTALRFHTFLLNYGPADFASLREWIEEDSFTTPSLPAYSLCIPGPRAGSSAFLPLLPQAG